MDSVTGSRAGGVWYADAELMNTYWRARPRNSSMSAWTCSGVNATQSTTASKEVSPSAVRTSAGSRTSACLTVASGGGGRSPVLPRLSTHRSMPCSIALWAQAELMTPLPPMKRTRNAVIPQQPRAPAPPSCINRLLSPGRQGDTNRLITI